MAENTQCDLGLFAAYAKHLGAKFDESELGKKLKDIHSKAVYGRANARYYENAAEEALKTNPPQGFTAQALDFMDRLGIPAKEIVGFTATPEYFLGKQAVDAVNKVQMDYLTKYGKGNRAVWDRVYKPQIQALRKQFQGTENPMFADIADKYWGKHENGGQIEGLKAPKNPFSRVARQAVGNLVQWNPMITALNVFEFTPKALAYAMEQGRPDAVLKGMAAYFQKTGGKFWDKIPELDQLGVYGVQEQGMSLLDLTENPLRGLAYYVGEAMAPGQGLEALEKIAFVSRLGNEPMIFLDHAGTDTLALMRYSLSATKMYLHMLDGVRQAKPEAFAALAAFSAMNAIQTGGASAIPAPAYAVLPEELKQSIAEFDDATGLNLAKHTFGTSFTEQVQPLAAPVLGAGLSIASQDIKGTGSALVRAAESAEEGNYTETAARILQATFALGQLGTIPGVNLTSKRVVDQLAKVAADEITLDELPGEVLEATKLYNEPEF